MYRDPPGIEPPKDDPAPIAVLGGRGVIGPYPRAAAIAALTALAWIVTLDQVRSVAEGLVPA